MFLTLGGAGNVDNLFQSVGHVSRAVGTLVNIMTDDEASCVRELQSATAPAGLTTHNSH